MTEKKQTCENCIYWKALSEPRGECRKNSPTLVISEDGRESAKWPKTIKGSWCGEHTLQCYIIGCKWCSDLEGRDL